MDRRPSNTLSPISITDVKDELKDEVFKIQQSPYLLDENGMQSIFAGTSSGRTLVEAFKRKLQENGQSCSDVETDAFFTPPPEQRSRSPASPIEPSPPPRLVSDQLISIFFQEWAPLFPVLYRPTFLSLYEGFVSDTDAIQDKQGIAQLYLVFGIAALSSNAYDKQQIDSYELQWTSALESTMMEKDDIHCEYPVDVDEEYVTERGFQPTLPGESTKLSAALALFRASRILSRVLDQNYPASASHEISLKKIVALNDELDVWLNNLAPHLRLHFAQDKPSTTVVCSRSFVLSLAYHFIRGLIHRPAVCTSGNVKLSSSVVALAASAKHSIQIIQLLEERKLSFSMCLNKHELLSLCGFGLLFQNQDVESGGKLRKDVQKQLQCVLDILDRDAAPGASQLRQLAEIANALAPDRLSTDNLDPYRATPANESMPSPSKGSRSSPQKQIKLLASRFAEATQKYVRQEPHENRRITLPSMSLDSFSNSQGRSGSQVSICSTISAQSEPTQVSSQNQNQNPSPHLCNGRPPAPAYRLKHVDNLQQQQPHRNGSVPNLDYFPFASDSPSTTSSLGPRKPPTNNNAPQSAQPTDWERLLGSIDNGQSNIYDGIYGGPPVDALLDVPSLTHTDGTTTCSSSYNTFDLPPDSFPP
ncbi:MAG: hypothetical protein Q9157_008484, partial [Trypethelium eluteriae]